MWKMDSFLQDIDTLDAILVVSSFAPRVRQGHYGRGLQIKVPTVTTALSAITTSIKLVGKQCTFKEAENEFVLPIKRLIEGLKQEDLSAIPQVAVPVAVPEECCCQVLYLTLHCSQATGDLILIAFYYLLQCSEYTARRFVKRRVGSLRHATRTKQFTVADVSFWKNSQQLPRNSTLKDLLQANSATLKITNQKNGKVGQTLHYELFDNELSPVKALARRVHHILSNGGTNASYLCEFFNEKQKFANVMPDDLLTPIRTAIRMLRLEHAGINPDLVGVHSLRAGGTTSLKLQGESATTIMKMKRWSGLTFLMYIHNQIGHLSKDLSSKMLTHVPFLNIAGIKK